MVVEFPYNDMSPIPFRSQRLIVIQLLSNAACIDFHIEVGHLIIFLERRTTVTSLQTLKTL